MTQAVPHLVNRLVIDTEDSFDDVRRRYESLVPAIDFAELTEVVGTGDLAALQAYIAAHTPHSFAVYWALDPMPVMRLSGHPNSPASAIPASPRSEHNSTPKSLNSFAS